MKTALVTGANKGIGFATCQGLAKRGFKVFLGSRDDTRGKKAVEELHNLGYADAELLHIDVASEASIDVAAKKLMTLTDHLDVLVNNAGIFIDGKHTALDVSSNIIIDTFTTNTLGALLTTRALVPLLEKSTGAQVINVSSGMGQLEDMNGGSVAYRLSKTALNAVTRILANELSGKNIRVNSICPGWVRTDMGGEGATRSVEQGSDTIIWLAEGNISTSGGFFRDHKKIAW